MCVCVYLCAVLVLRRMNTFAVLKHTKKRIHADECDGKVERKYSKGYFHCIDCGNDVFVRRGKKRSWHFAHYHEEDAKKCPHANGGETKDHYNAKHFVAKNIGICKFAVERCPNCMKRKYFVGRHQGKLQHIDECMAEVEMRIPGTQRIADVAAVNRCTGKIVAAIEIFHTHEVDADKRSECARLGVPILEVTTEEVQWAQSLLEAGASATGSMQLSTTRMESIKCAQCIMRECVLHELQLAIDYERWYNDSCVSFHIRKTKVVECKNPVPDYVLKRVPEYTQDEYLAEVEYGRNYDYMWVYHEARINARKQYDMLANERNVVLKCGYDAARDKIGQRREASKCKAFRHRSCITKCKACQKWVFDDNPDDVCEVESSSMTSDDWKKLFANDPKQYRRKYMRADGEHNSIQVHEACAMECPGCQDMCLLQHISKFGACYSCCKYFKAQLSRLEKMM